MPFASIPEAIEELRAGRMLVVVDDEDRENEGDLTMAADCITPEAINFMAKYGRGLICLTLTEEKCRSLNLPPMVPNNLAPPPVPSTSSSSTITVPLDRPPTPVSSTSETRGADSVSNAI